MARPQKFRHSREALDDPQIAEKLGRFVIEIETLRTQRKQIDDQIAAAYDAVDDAGFEKKFVRKNIALRAKETDVRRDEEEGSEAYEIAIEKGVSLACARSKPSSTQSYAEAKGRGFVATLTDEQRAEALAYRGEDTHGELTDTQEQPETPAKQFQAKASEDNGATGTANVEVPSDSMAGEVSRLASGRTDAGEAASVDLPTISPSPETPQVIADEEAAPPAKSSAPISSSVTPPPPGGTDKAEADSSPASATNPWAAIRPHCLNPELCAGSGSKHCYACLKARDDLAVLA